MTKETVTIYALCDDTGVKYVGRTTLAPQQRLAMHLAGLKCDATPKGAWLRVMQECGQTPAIVVLEVTTPANGRDAERAHISRCLADGCNLTNATALRPARPIARRKGKVVGVRFDADVAARLIDYMLRERRSLASAVNVLLAEALATRTATVPAVPAVPAAPQPEQEEREA